MLSKAFYNLILVSIPEGIFILGLFYIMSSNLGVINRSKKNLLLIILPIVIPGIITNICRYNLKWSHLDIFKVYLICLFLILSITYNIFNLKKLLITCGAILIPIIINITLEGLATSILLYQFQKTMEEINLNIISNFAVTLPMRFVEYAIVYYVYKKVYKETKDQFKYFKEYSFIIFKTIKGFVYTFIGLPIILLSLLLCCKYFIVKGILINSNMSTFEIITITNVMFFLHISAVIFYFNSMNTELKRIKEINKRRNVLENIKSIAKIQGNKDILQDINFK